MAQTQAAWKVGDPSPAGGGALVHYRPATKAEWAAFTHRETPSALPPRVDNASPEQIAELGELWVDEQTGYKARVKPDAGAGDRSGAQTADRAGTRPAAGAGADDRAEQTRRSDSRAAQPGAPVEQADRVAELERQLAEARGQGGGGR
jgi:hypothetical protein